VEVVTLRLRARKAVARPEIAPLPRERGHCGTRPVFVEGHTVEAPLFRRAQLGRHARRGPLLVLDYGATVLVPSNWSALVDRAGNLVLHRG